MAGDQALHFLGEYGALAALAALMVREQSGHGQIVDISIQEAVAHSFLDAGSTFYQANGMIPTRMGTQHVANTPFAALPCRDGYVHWGAGSLAHWQTLVDWMETEIDVGWIRALGLDKEARRLAYKDAIDATLTEFARNHDKRPLFLEAQRRHLPVTPVSTLPDVAADPQLEALDYFVEVEGVRVPGSPLAMSRTPGRVSRAAPSFPGPAAGAEAVGWTGRPFRATDRLSAAGPPLAGGWTPGRAAPSASASPASHDGSHESKLAVAPGVRAESDDRTDPASRIGSQFGPWSRDFEDQSAGRGVAALARRPLAGVRVLDFSWAVAGPLAARHLAALGAEVWKVETAKRLDMLRIAAPHPELNGLFCNLNAGKRSLSIDLKRAEGIALARRLVAVADLLIENQSPRALPQLGLDYAALTAIRPDFILLSMPAFGSRGPYRDFIAYGPNIVSATGLVDLTGYPDGPPTGVNFGLADFHAGVHAAYAALAALRYRARTGEGQAIDLSQFAVAAGLLGPELRAVLAGEAAPSRIGNRHPGAAPHGIYPCAGVGRWLAIAIFEDGEWRRFGEASGLEWARAPVWETIAGRKAGEDELDRRLSAWTATQEAELLMHRLQASGVAAGVVQNVRDLIERDPHLRARGYYYRDQHPALGELWLDNPPIHFAEMSTRLQGRPGPLLGEGNRAGLVELLGLDPDALAALEAAGVVDAGRIGPWR
jgi:benzylsuccinate CoA-transferase BbsF subunit